MNVKRAVIHLINKEAGKTRDDVPACNLGLLLGTSNDKLNAFAQRVVDAYRSIGGTYGKFNDNIDEYPFSSSFRSTYNPAATDERFTELSQELSLRLHSMVKTINSAVAESLVFLEYEDDQRRFLLIIILNGGIGNYIDKSTGNQLTEVQSFNFKDVHHAVRVNIDSCINECDSYLNFFSRAKRDTSDYFKDTIGCTNAFGSKKHISDLKSAIKKYCENNNLDENEKIRTISGLLSTHVKERANTEISLATIANAAFPDDPDAFKEFANSEDFQVPSQIIPKMSDLNIFKKIQWKKGGYSIIIERECIENREIQLDDNNRLIISNIPQDKLEEIRKIMGEEQDVE